MNFDKRKLMAQLALNGLTTAELAKKLKINAATLHRKMNGESDFYRHEIFAICTFLKIENPMEIFFANEVAETQVSK